MTRERKLAIQMWQGIRKEIENGKLNDQVSVINFKVAFTKKHKLNWMSSCWFCQYFQCERCPLYKPFMDNGFPPTCADYWIASNGIDGVPSVFLDAGGNCKKELRLRACDNIIKMLIRK